MTHTIVMTGATRGFGRVAVERILEGDAEAHLVFLARGAAGTELATHLGQNGRAVTSIPTDLLSLGSDRFTAPSRIVLTVSDAHFGDFRHNAHPDNPHDRLPVGPTQPPPIYTTPRPPRIGA